MSGRMRRATMAFLPAACLVLAACTAGGGSGGTGAPPVVSGTVTATADAAGGSSPTAQASRSALPAVASSPGTAAASVVPVPGCTADALTASAAHRVEPTNPDDTYAVDLSLTNTGHRACTLRGFPTVAIAGQGDPRHSKPLRVTRQGTPQQVRLAPGHAAWLRLTFRQVLGEADGYCRSGATPAAPPSLVVGVPGGGIQVGMDDGGNFAECDDVVRATAFLPARP